MVKYNLEGITTFKEGKKVIENNTIDGNIKVDGEIKYNQAIVAIEIPEHHIEGLHNTLLTLKEGNIIATVPLPENLPDEYCTIYDQTIQQDATETTTQDEEKTNKKTTKKNKK